MSILVDTSALYAALDADDPNHARAAQSFRSLTVDELVTHNYVVVESVALVQRRLGATAVRDLIDGILRPLRLIWIDQQLHRAAETALLAAASRSVSLVDRVSFELMRREGIRRAVAFDRDFNDAGFETVP